MLNRKKMKFITALTFSLLANFVSAGDLSLSVLYGDNYVVEPASQTTATLEYATGWRQGDLFLFTDFKHYNQSDVGESWYGEFSPRFKLLDTKLPVFAAFTWERGKNSTEAYLGGLGTNLSITGFKFTKLNVYYRDSPNKDGSGWQTTLSWAMPLFNDYWVFDGYFDWVFSSQETATHFHFNPQLKWDMQKQFGSTVRWYLGLEYDYWNKKYGIDSSAIDSNQNTASLLVKVHF